MLKFWPSLASVRKRFIDVLSSRSDTTGSLGTASDGSKWTPLSGVIQVFSGKAKATTTPTDLSPGSDYPMSVIEMPTLDNTVKIKNTENGSAAALWVQTSSDWWMVGVEATFNVIPGPTTYTAGTTNYTGTAPNYSASTVFYTSAAPTYTMGVTNYTAGPTNYTSGGLQYTSQVTGYTAGLTTYTQGPTGYWSSTPYWSNTNYTASVFYTEGANYFTNTVYYNYLASVGYTAGTKPTTASTTYTIAPAPAYTAGPLTYTSGKRYTSISGKGYTSSTVYSSGRNYSVNSVYNAATTYNAGATPYNSNNFWSNDFYWNYWSTPEYTTAYGGPYTTGVSYYSITNYTTEIAFTSAPPQYTSSLSYWAATPYTTSIDYSGSTPYSQNIMYSAGDQSYTSSVTYTSSTPYTSEVQPDTYAYTAALTVRKSIADNVSTLSSLIVSTAQTIKSIMVSTSGDVITARAYSDENLVTQIGDDLVYTATGAVVNTVFGISVSPSDYQQSDIIGSEVVIERS